MAMSATAHPGPEPTALAAAFYYASIGLHVVPISPGKKHPPIPGWQDAATTDPDTITNWWTGLYRDHGVGIVTGPRSGVWVLDIDVSDGKPGRENLDQLLAQHGPLPVTVTAATGSGGRHFLFRWDPDRPVTNGHATQLPAGLDIRGHGGQIVVAPTIHPNGQPYLWRPGRAPWETVVADGPDWLYGLLHRPPPEPTPYTQPSTAAGPDDSAAAWLRQQHDWHQVLDRDGWTEHSRRGDDTYWTRPGKNPRDGHSAVLHGTDGPLVIFTTEIPPGLANAGRATTDGSGISVSMFGYLAGTRYGGDRSACARDARLAIRAIDRPATGLRLPTPTDSPTEPGQEPEPPGPSTLHDYEVDWDDLWEVDADASEWLAEPLIPAGSKVTHIYAPRAEGKSALSLYVAAAIATGRPVLDRPLGQPLRVAYIDVEMSRTELRDYLEEYGYGPDTDLANLRYLVDAPIPYLDTVEGGLEVVRWVEAVAPDVVFVDSITSVLQGEENSNDAYQRLFNFTIAPLKRAGIPTVWTGNSGKDREKGSRGGSRKEDLMDCIWRMERQDGGVINLHNTKRRASWIPQKLVLQRDVADNGLITYTVPEGDVNEIPVGAMDVARLIDALELPLDVATRTAARALRESGQGRRMEVIRGALKYRRWAAAKRGLTAGPTPGPTPGPTFGTHADPGGLDGF